MVSFSSVYCVSIVLLFNSVRFAASIFCYDCNSAFDPRCGPDFDPFSLGVVNCSLQDPPEHINVSEPTMCRTIRMDIFGETRVVRKCGYLEEAPSNATCRRVTGVGEVYVTYCACKSDLCNSSVSHHNGQMALFTILFASLLIYTVE